MFLTEDEVLMGYKDTDQNSSVRSLILFIFAVGWALCGRPQLQTRISDTVTFSVKYFNPLKLYPLSENIF